ncbi:ECF transporter S component [Rathayibacter soli]|uniref:ECF transporter S component n=1 Tax=Rathayibacter soli TaxID=3144168 RepID=UPI0027E42942|nr:ECF transporter S component [Glaciibacter superstes]
MHKLSTRLLLTLAAIGVAGGIVCLPTIYAGTALLAVAPPLYGLIVGAYVFPGVIAQSLLRRGGVAFATATLAGLVAAPFFPGGVAYIPAFALVGALQEVPFAVSAYRYWRGWVFYLTAVVVGLSIAVAEFIAVAGERAPLWVQIVKPGVFVVSLVVFTVLGRAVAAGLNRAGVGRGLALPIDRRRVARVQNPVP